MHRRQGIGRHKQDLNFNRVCKAQGQAADAVYRADEIRSIACDAIRRLGASESFITLCRANATVFGETADAVEKGQPWFHVGGTPRYRFEQVLDVHWLSKHQRHTIKDSFIATFSNLDEYAEYAGEASDAEAMSRVKIARRYGDKIPSILDAINARRGAAASEESALRLIANTPFRQGHGV